MIRRETIEALDPRPLAHLPLIGALVDRLQIVDVVDRPIPPDPRSKISHGDCVKAMILNLLFGRVALYSMEDWLAQTDTELLVGRGVEAGAFNDTRLAGALDALWNVGTEQVLSTVVQDYLRSPDAPGSYAVYQDKTSISLYSAYSDTEGGPPVPSAGEACGCATSGSRCEAVRPHDGDPRMSRECFT